MSRHANALASYIAKVVKILDRKPPSGEIYCSHHGVSFGYGDLSIGLASRGRKLQVMIYRTSGPRPINRKCSKCGHVRVIRRDLPKQTVEQHDERREAVERALKSPVIEKWNGGDGADGQSFVLARPCPKALADALAGRNVSGAAERFEQWLTPAYRIRTPRQSK